MPAKQGPLPLGKRLAKLRKERNTSLQSLANETGLATSYISQIDKAEVIPPVAVILQLSRALEIDSSILLKEEKRQIGTKAHDDFQKRTEDYSYRNLTPDAQHKHLKAFKVFIDPRSDHKGVSYQHLGEEFIYVLKGELGFAGFLVSDWQAVDQVAQDYRQAVVTAINAGLDMIMVPTDYKAFIDGLFDAKLVLSGTPIGILGRDHGRLTPAAEPRTRRLSRPKWVGARSTRISWSRAASASKKGCAACSRSTPLRSTASRSSGMPMPIM